MNGLVDGDAVLVLTDDDARAVARARSFAAQRLRDGGLDDLVVDAQLVVSELVTNALLHAGPPVRVVVHVAPPSARIEVHDPSPVLPIALRVGDDAMTGRGMRIVGTLATAIGADPTPEGKCLWAEVEVGAARPDRPGAGTEQLVAMWLDESPTPPAEPRHRVSLGAVPTDLLLTAKSHVDNLVREFTLAASGAATGLTPEVPPALAELIEVVVHGFAEPRASVRRQAVRAQAEGRDHVTLELHLPLDAARAGEAYLRALDEADAYCRASRLLTLESPPRHRVFRRWYVGELVGQLQAAAAGEQRGPGETFEARLLREVDAIAMTERREARAARLHELSLSLASALTPESVARAALDASASVLGASGGAVLLAANRRMVAVPATIGYDAQLVTRIAGESPGDELPAATALRTGEDVWLESAEDCAARFPELMDLEPQTVAMAAVPLEVGKRRLGALRLSFAERRLFDDDERSFVRAIAAQTAQAIDRAQLWTARNDAAQRLQRGLLPPALPSAAGLEISAVYHPLTASLEVGGDFADVWRCDDGRLAVAIGDVSGHGPEAAAMTALVRHTLRALAVTSADPVAILELLDRALRASLADTERFATVAFGFLGRSAGASWRLDLATGGHPGPIVVRSGEADVVALAGTLLGILDAPVIERGAVLLEPGDEVVLVTDGVTDVRDVRGAWFGVGGVVTAVRDRTAPGGDTAGRISEAVLAHAGGQLQDDFAALAVRCLG